MILLLDDVALLFQGIGQLFAGFELPFKKMDVLQFFKRLEPFFTVEKPVHLGFGFFKELVIAAQLLGAFDYHVEFAGGKITQLVEIGDHQSAETFLVLSDQHGIADKW